MKKILFLLITAVSFSFSAFARAAADLEIHFINVGCGDSILLKNASGSAILIDTGYPGTGSRLAEYLRVRGVESLDHLIVTHPHADHAGAAVEVLERFPAGRLWDNGQPITVFFPRFPEEMVRAYEERFRSSPDYRVLSRGDVIAWQGAVLRVLWPPDTVTFSDWNTNSLVIMLSFGTGRALLAGDLNIAGEQRLLELSPDDLSAGIFKVGHHGAGDATSPEFIRAVSPRGAVISVGPNPWGYPSEEVIGRLRGAGVQVFRTDRDGDVVFRCCPGEGFELLAAPALKATPRPVPSALPGG